MVTICSFCGKEIDEENEQNEGKKYLLCRCGQGFVPKGANSYQGEVRMLQNKSKEDKKMADESKEKKKSKATTVRELLAKGKSHEEITKETGIKAGYIKSVIAHDEKVKEKKVK